VKKMNEPLSIVGFSSISALGHLNEKNQNAYNSKSHALTRLDEFWQGKIPLETQKVIDQLRDKQSYKHLDKTALYAIHAARQAMKMAHWNKNEIMGINIGCSRGPTEKLEEHHADFLQSEITHIQASPSTTAGNISSWLAQDLSTQGPMFSHSITCSSAFYAFLNGIAWIKSGMVEKFLVGGTEAPLTPFTIAQMKALKIYSKMDVDYPCRSLDFDKKENTLVLGEGAGVACIEKGRKNEALCYIVGWGYGSEKISNSVSISKNGISLQKAMLGATENHNLGSIDAIIMHAPGTINGDKAEQKAIKSIFQNKVPFCTSNKWKIGHTLGASGMHSLDLALYMLNNNKVVEVPFIKTSKAPKQIKKILINTVGFGGNAASLLIQKAE
tara:strand:+ start:7858 stop:9012 length:1155 start_codon:yes stop_codon:yes gene_type:complete